MPTTPTYALPYPALSDPPDGPGQMQALAEATETALSSEVATLNTTIDERNPSPIFGTWANGGSPIAIPAGATGDDTLLWTIPIPDPGWSYRVRVFCCTSIEWSANGYGRFASRIGGSLNTGTEIADVDFSRLPYGWTPAIIPGAMSDVLTGAQTVYVGCRTTVSCTAHIVDNRSFCNVDIFPA